MSGLLDELAFLFKKEPPKTTVLFGSITSWGSSLYGVILDGTESSVVASKGCSAQVGDRVLLILNSTGSLTVVARVPTAERKAGRATVTSGDPNTTVTLNVSFGMTFGSTPAVVVSPNVLNPHLYPASTRNITQTGFDLLVHNASAAAGSPLTVDWIAMERI